MNLLSKSDLKYEYSWTVYGNDDPEITGEPDSTLFNRKEGYEVIYLINKLAKKWKLKKKASGLKIERLINNELPGSIRSQENVKKWISDNWEKY
ncbi:MAG: hypothetical protein KAS53_00630 [Candidatus Cloacimonetes bacterium]|nr:hypothetical protein [Candidatus Cloacimonadota bacterium]MCK5603247.1 hypothetical protein [Candidatus Pacearchaeota archaeon]